MRDDIQPKGLIIYTALCTVMICQAFGLDVTRTGNMHIPSFVNQGEALHIINSAGIVYHQHAVLYHAVLYII
ncbi:MAG: hypothetical protein IJX82_08300, partial [Clostridia bacterium]|nr:hypothetical protein [Clostridia bacterium]